VKPFHILTALLYNCLTVKPYYSFTVPLFCYLLIQLACDGEATGIASILEGGEALHTLGELEIVGPADLAKNHDDDYSHPETCVMRSRQGSRRLPLLDLRLAGFESGGDDMPITAFDGPSECIVFR
jgi:hypothetical protein